MKKLQRRGDEKKKYSLIIDYIQVLQQLAMETRQKEHLQLLLKAKTEESLKLMREKDRLQLDLHAAMVRGDESQQLIQQLQQQVSDTIEGVTRTSLTSFFVFSCQS